MNIFKRLWRRLTQKTTPDWESITDQIMIDRHTMWQRVAEYNDHLTRQALDQPPYIAVSDDGQTGIEEPPLTGT